MARREGPSGEEPRLGRAPVLSSCEFEDLGRRLIVIDGVSEFLEVDAHASLRDRWSDGASFYGASTRYSAAPTPAACAFFAHRGVCGGRGGFCGAAFDATRRYGLKAM
mmetsp:Transcript_12335/g.36153  ORF Transcript_12335/g.36153 Transcript_12335/m.36153 type:complete len:108 (-) Transcript_12335:51-374(-)